MRHLKLLRHTSVKAFTRGISIEQARKSYLAGKQWHVCMAAQLCLPNVRLPALATYSSLPTGSPMPG